MSIPRSAASDRTPLGDRPGDAGLRGRLTRAIETHADRWVRLRRRIHAIPEPSNEERETTKLVAETLRELGLEPRVMHDDVGVVVDLDLGAPGETYIALRSELDCVEVNDDKQAAYASTKPGLCHACGHDVHTSVLLAAAQAILESRDEWGAMPHRHNLRFIFQPAEESATGARSMIKQGVLGGVEAILALHVDPYIEAGHLGIRNGPLTSACKSFQVTIRGRSGHSARPHESIDPVPAATNIVSQIYQLGPRSVDCRYPLVVTVSSIQSGQSFNAIPDRAIVRGTLRAARLGDLEAVQRRMELIVKGVGEATGCDASLEFVHACPPTDNDPEIVATMVEATEWMIGAHRVDWLEVPSLGGEDFAFFQELVPGVIARLGAAMPDPRARRPLHSSLFDVDESAIPAGAGIIAATALRLAEDYPGPS